MGMGKRADAVKEEVTFGAAKAVVWQRGDGRWAVSSQLRGLLVGGWVLELLFC